MAWALPKRQAVVAPENEDAVLQTQFSKAMLEMPAHIGIGVAFSYILLMAHREPLMVRRVLNEKVVREGFRGVSMLETLKRLCR